MSFVWVKRQGRDDVIVFNKIPKIFGPTFTAFTLVVFFITNMPAFIVIEILLATSVLVPLTVSQAFHCESLPGGKCWLTIRMIFGETSFSGKVVGERQGSGTTEKVCLFLLKCSKK